MAEQSNTSTKWKLAGAGVLLVTALGFVWSQYASTSTLPEPEGPPQMAEGPGGGPPPPMNFRNMSEDERRDFRETMRAEMEEILQLTEEQKAKVAELDKQLEGKEGREAMRERMEAMRDILTPEQQEKARGAMRGRMRAHMMERASVLPPEEQAKFLEKLEEREAQMRERGGRGRGGPGGTDGPPPDGPRRGEGNRGSQSEGA